MEILNHKKDETFRFLFFYFIDEAETDALDLTERNVTVMSKVRVDNNYYPLTHMQVEYKGLPAIYFEGPTTAWQPGLLYCDVDLISENNIKFSTTTFGIQLEGDV